MNTRTHLARLATLVAAAVVCALVANAFASRDRQMKLIGYYPNAQKVPPRETTTAPPPPPLPVTATVAPAVPTTTTVAPAPTPVVTTTQAPAPVKVQPATTTTAPPPVKQAAKEDPLKKFAPHEKQPYIEIAYDDAKLLHDHGALFLDARRTSVFEQGHIAGARPMSVWESDIDDKVAKLFNERSDPAQQALPIVAYCSGGDCEDSHMLAQKLYGALFNNVYVYKDGYPDWQKHNAPVKTGGQP
jgi:rhodanese-related sulfurtransferase